MKKDMSEKEWELRDTVCRNVALFYEDELCDYMRDETSDRQEAAKYKTR